MSRSATMRLRFAIIGALVVPFFGRLALTGTGHSGDLYRYLVPMLVGSVAGYLLGSMRARVMSEHEKLECTVQELQRQIASKEELTAALSEREGYLRGILDHAQPIIYLKDKDGRYLTVNRRYEQATHLSLDAVKGRLAREVVPSELASCFAEQDERILRTRKAEVSEEAVSLPDGNRTFISSRFPLLDDHGEVWAVGGVCTDITERKLAEEKLRAEQERLAVTLRSIGDGVITTDIEGRVVLINAIGEKLTGWTQAEAEGRPALEVLPLVGLDDESPAESPLARVLEKGESFARPGHAHLFSRQGIRYCISDRAAPIRDSEDRIMGLVWALRDVTDHVTSEKELFRVSKLEAVGVLAGGIAHDFNNLLVAILGSIDLSLEYLSPDHEAYELLKAAEQASVRARDLTGQLLTFSAGGDPVKEIASLGEVIRDSTDFVLRGTNVACEYEIPEDLWLVDVDTGQMSQVIQNLALNAKAAMPEGGRIEIGASNETRQSEGIFRSADPMRYVRISVSDQGVGIPRDVIDKVFDPYFSTSSDGTGLGLAVAHSIVKNHDGHISVKSEPGQGSCFTIDLPAAERQNVASSEIRQEEFRGGGLVIVMDDDALVQDTASAMLKRLGFEVALANDGHEALAIYERSKEKGRSPAAVIMDLTIPGGMGGVLAVEKILAFDPDARVVVSSGYSTDPAMAHCEDYGFKASLIKPFTLREMSRVLRSVLR